MSQFQELIKNTEKLQDMGFKKEFDLTPYLLPIEDVMKKIIASKNPGLSKEHIDMIVDSEEISLAKLDQDSDNDKELNSDIKDDSLTEQEKQKRKEELQRRKEAEKERIKEQVKQIKTIYKEKVKQVKQEAKDLIKEIKAQLYSFFKEVKNLIKKSITSVIQISSSIPAIAITAAAPPWNIPLAISYTMTLIDTILNLVAQIKAIIPFTLIFEKLGLVIDDKLLQKFSAVLNAQILIVLGLFDKLSILDTLINKLLDKILSLINPSNSQKTFKKATKKLKKLGYFDTNNSTYNIDGVDVRAKNEEDASEAKDILDTFVVDSNKVTDYKNKIDTSDLSKFSNISAESENINNLPSEPPYVYDVKLPDGGVLLNQTDVDLQDLSKRYDLVIEDLEDLTNKLG